MPSWQRQEVSCKKLPLFKPGWLFLFSLSFILEENIHLISNRAQELGRGGERRQPNALGWPNNSCPHIFPYLLRDAEPATCKGLVVPGHARGWLARTHMTVSRAPLATQWGADIEGHSTLSSHVGKWASPKLSFWVIPPDRSLCSSNTCA